MSKAVLISIRPKWCQKIVSGEKTIEIRKTRPRMAPPFKCYIYCTKPQFYGGGKVVGEFTCTGFIPFRNARPCFVTETPEEIERMACLTRKEIWEYAPVGDPIGWRISDLKIYDTPKALDSFWAERICTRGRDTFGCEGCWDCEKRPPQSWCYVEEKQ